MEVRPAIVILWAGRLIWAKPLSTEAWPCMGAASPYYLEKKQKKDLESNKSISGARKPHKGFVLIGCEVGSDPLTPTGKSSHVVVTWHCVSLSWEGPLGQWRVWRAAWEPSDPAQVRGDGGGILDGKNLSFWDMVTSFWYFFWSHYFPCVLHVSTVTLCVCVCWWV